MINILISIIFIQLVIFVHELGHYLIAKKVGADVYEFSVGLGPKIFQFKKNETLYTLRAIPLLGHVLFQEIEEDETTESITEIPLSENNLKNKGYLSELSVYLAGPVFNFITAFIVLCGIYIYSGFPTMTIDSVLDKSPAQEAGITKGDTLLAIDNIDIYNWSDVSSTINKLKKDSINLTIQRKDNSIENISVNTIYDKNTNNYSIGISPQFKQDLFKSINYGFKNTIKTIQSNAVAISELFLGWIPGFGNDSYNVELTGPIGTIQTVSKQSKESLDSLLLMFASFNINVGVINLIPLIPVLDGGQAFIRTIEAIRKKSFKENTIVNLKLGGALFLIGLMILTTFKDIVNLF